MYIVIEIQTNDSVATIVNAYDNKDEAEARYHTILSVAATSKVKKHSAVLLTEDGYYVKSECYTHESEI